MVASSYNAGMGRISGELVKQDADSSFDLWLVEETTRYVYRIMAIKQIFEAPYKYGFVLRAQDLYKPIACESSCRLDGYGGGQADAGQERSLWNPLFPDRVQ